ncbi:hypothetical protein SON50_13410 [Staphylococcus aureus]
MSLVILTADHGFNINPFLRFLFYFLFSVPLTVLVATFGIKLISFLLVPLKVCFGIALFLGIIMTIFLAIMCFTIPNI